MDINSIFTGGNVKPNTIAKNIIRQYLHNTDRIQQFHIRSYIDNKDFSCYNDNARIRSTTSKARTLLAKCLPI